MIMMSMRDQAYIHQSREPLALFQGPVESGAAFVTYFGLASVVDRSLSEVQSHDSGGALEDER